MHTALIAYGDSKNLFGYTSVQEYGDMLIPSIQRNLDCFQHNWKHYFQFICNQNLFPYGWEDLSELFWGIFPETINAQGVSLNGQMVETINDTFQGAIASDYKLGLPRYLTTQPKLYRFEPCRYDYAYYYLVDENKILKMKCVDGKGRIEQIKKL